jgi:hypothetical protein
VTSAQYAFDEEPWPDPTWQRWIGRPALSVTQPTDVMVTAEYDGMVDRQRVVLLPSASTVSLDSVFIAGRRRQHRHRHGSGRCECK